MVTINTRKTKKMKFGVNVSGIQTRDLKGSVRMEIGGIEYGFPTVVEDDKLAVVIPPLDEIVAADLKEGQTVKARLDVVADKTILTPWADSFRVEKPITVEATVAEIDDVDDVVTPTVSIELAEETDEEPEKPIKEKCGPGHEKTSKKKNSKLAKMLAK